MKMKHLLISSFLLLCPICFAQQVEISTAISPDDLGAYKWILSGTAGEKSVVVFRVTTVREWPEGKVTTKIYDSVHYSPGKKQTESAFFIDPHYFDNKEEDPTWHFRVFGGVGGIEGRYAGHSSGGDKAEIRFESERLGKTKKVLETFITSYDDAVKSYGDLPPISPDRGWIWAGSPTTSSEAGAEQPATAPESKPRGDEKPQPDSKPASR